MGRSSPQQEGEPADLWEARRQPLDGCRPVLPHFVEKEGFVVKGFSKQQIWVLLGAALFQCALIGVLVNSASVLLAQIQGELGLPMTQISAYHTIKSVVGAVGGAFFAAVFFRSHRAGFMLTSIVLVVISHLLLVIGAGSWLWYLAAVVVLCLADVLACPLLLREPGSAGRAFLDHVLAAHGLTAEPAWESISTQAILQAVSAGLGVSFLPEKLVRVPAERGLVATRSLSDEAFSRSHYMVWHNNKHLTASALDLMDLCRHMGAEA